MSISHFLLATENMKKHQYEERVHNVEHRTFTPLVFSAVDGMGPAISTTFLKDSTKVITDYSLASLQPEFFFTEIHHHAFMGGKIFKW